MLPAVTQTCTGDSRSTSWQSFRGCCKCCGTQPCLVQPARMYRMLITCTSLHCNWPGQASLLSSSRCAKGMQACQSDWSQSILFQDYQSHSLSCAQHLPGRKKLQEAELAAFQKGLHTCAEDLTDFLDFQQKQTQHVPYKRQGSCIARLQDICVTIVFPTMHKTLT